MKQENKDMQFTFNQIQLKVMERCGVQPEDLRLVPYRDFLQVFQIPQIATTRFELYIQHQLEQIQQLEEDMDRVMRDGLSVHEVGSSQSVLIMYVHQDQFSGTAGSFFEYLKQLYREVNAQFSGFVDVRSTIQNEATRTKGQQQVQEKRYDDQWRRDSIIAQELRVQERLRTEIFERRLSESIKQAAEKKLSLAAELSSCAQQKAERVFSLKKKAEKDAEEIWQRENRAHFVKHNLDRASLEISYPNGLTYKYFRRDKEVKTQQTQIRRVVAQEFNQIYRVRQFDSMQEQFDKRFLKKQEQEIQLTQDAARKPSTPQYITQYDRKKTRQLEAESAEKQLAVGRSIIFGDCNPTVLARTLVKPEEMGETALSPQEKAFKRTERQRSASLLKQQLEKNDLRERSFLTRSLASAGPRMETQILPARPQSNQNRSAGDLNQRVASARQNRAAMAHTITCRPATSSQMPAQSSFLKKKLESQEARVNSKAKQFEQAKKTVMLYDKLKEELQMARPGTAAYNTLNRRLLQLGIE